MYILQQNRRHYRTSFMGMRMCIHITFNEKSFIFGIDPDQKSDINKLVLMDINIIYTMQDAARAT